MISRARSFVRLVRWLGPWSDDVAMPEVPRSSLEIDGPRGLLRVDVYGACGDVRGLYVIAPGLHHDGPADPRMQRFCAVLAHAGFEVRVPYIKSYLDQILDPAGVEDFNVVVEDAVSSGHPVALFSISFGSLLALRAAAEPSLRDKIETAIIFGGYADFAETVDFCMRGHVNGVKVANYDPLNLPVLFMNSLDVLPGLPEDVEGLTEAWRTYMRRTWGNPAARKSDGYLDIAREISAMLAPELRPMFEKGVGLDPSGVELLLAHSHKDRSFLDPRSCFGDIKCRVHLIHGADDDVIHYSQLDALEAAMPDHVYPRRYVTGMYGHTKKEGAVEGVLGEMKTMVRMLGLLSSPFTPSKRSSKGAA